MTALAGGFDESRTAVSYAVKRVSAIVFGCSLFLTILLALGLLENARAQSPDLAAASQIRILSPADGAVFTAPAHIVVNIAGTDVPNVGHVISLYERGMLLHAVVLDPFIPLRTDPVAFNFDFDWDKVRAGRYVLTAMIDGISSDPVTVIVRKHRHR